MMDIAEERRASERLRQLLKDQAWENDLLEFKTNVPDFEKIGKTIAAIANSAALKNADCGYIIFGVVDKTLEIVGTRFNPDADLYKNQHVPHWLSQKLYPQPHFTFSSFDYYPENCAEPVGRIVIITIYAASYIPIDFEGIRYIRNGAVTVSLRKFPEMERKLWAQLSRLGFLNETAAAGLTAEQVLGLLNVSKAAELLHLLLETPDSQLSFLLTEKLIVKNLDGYAVTNRAALLLARDLRNFQNLHNYFIRVITHQGASKQSLSYEKAFYTGYVSGFNEVMLYLTQQLPHWEAIDPDGVRRERKTVPNIALRELLANCIIHQDLANPLPIMIEIFTDSIVFNNSGTPGVPIEHFIDTYSKTNEPIASFMERCHLCEERGSGIDKIVMALEEEHTAPLRVDALFKSTSVTLPFHREFTDMSTNERLRCCAEHCVICYINRRCMTNTSLRERFGLDNSYVHVISQLIQLAVKEQRIKPLSAETRRTRSYIPFWSDADVLSKHPV